MSQNKASLKKYQIISSALFLVAICFLFYHNTFDNGFVYDDHDQIINNPWIRDFRNIPTIFSSGVWSFREFGGSAGIYYRPFMHLFFSIEYHFFQSDPSEYHMINVCLHALNAVVVFMFLRLLLSAVLKESQKTRTDVVAFFAAIIFAVHPINSEVVNWISAIPELTFSLFSLLAFYCYIKAEHDKKNYFFSLLFFSLGLLCKETALTLPAMLLAYDLIKGIHKKYKIFKRIALWVAANYPFFIISILYLILRERVLNEGIHHGSLHYEYIFLVFAWGVEIFLKNIGEILFPYNQGINPVYHMDDFFLFYLVFACISLFFCLYLTTPIRKLFFTVSQETRRLVLLSFALFAIPLLPALNYIALPYYVLDERYLYLSSIGFSLLLAFFLLKIADFVKNKPLTTGIFFALIAILGVSSYVTVTRRNTQWKNDLSLFSDAVSKNSDSPLAQANLAGVYCDLGNVDECKAHYESACNLSSNFKKDTYEKCLKTSDYNSSVGMAYFQHNDFDNAIKYYELALDSNVLKPKIYNNLGSAYYAKRDFTSAEKYFLQSATISPNSPSVFKKLGALYCGEHNLSQADRYFSKALELGSSEGEISAEREKCFKISS